MTTEATPTTTPTATPDPKTEAMKAKGAAFAAAVPKDVWQAVCVMKGNGKADLEETRRCVNYALRDYLKGSGQLYQGGSAPSNVDWANLEKATYHAFVSLAKDSDKGPSAHLMEVVYAGMTALQPSFADMDKVRKLVRQSLDRPTSIFQVNSTGKNFEGATVTLKEPAKATPPTAYKKWAEMQAPAAAPAPIAPAAPPAAAPAPVAAAAEPKPAKRARR